MLDLFVEILQIELVLGDFLLEPGGFFGVDLLLGFFDQRNHIAHAQDSVGHSVWMKNIQGCQFFASGNILDWLADGVANGKCRTTPGISVHFCQNNPVKIQTLIKSSRCVHGILSRHGIHHKERLVRLNAAMNFRNLVHHGLVHRQSAGGIHQDHRVTFGFSLFDGLRGDEDWVLLIGFGVNRHPDLFTQDFELVHSGRAVNIAGDHQDLLALGFEKQG